ncbi:MAG: hypothetical protein LBD54_00605 [Puniceicoccales bacterium]|jgi:hypothetical protein|nr:hypothetical protein [Puniceicoccales bacterium]
METVLENGAQGKNFALLMSYSPSLDSEGIARFAGTKPQTYGLWLAKTAKRKKSV